MGSMAVGVRHLEPVLSGGLLAVTHSRGGLDVGFSLSPYALSKRVMLIYPVLLLVMITIFQLVFRLRDVSVFL